MTGLLIELIPERYRDEIVGDIFEESRRNQDDPKQARRRLNAELARSIPRLFRLHFQQNEDDSMKHAKWIAAAAIIVVGLLQAWDSGILNAPPLIGVMVGVAIAIGIAGLFTTNEVLRLGIAALVFVLLFAARVISPVRLPELTLVGLPIFLILVLGPRFLALAKEKNQPRGPGAAA